MDMIGGKGALKMRLFLLMTIAVVATSTGCTSRFGKTGDALLASAFTPGPPAQLVFSQEPTDSEAASQILVNVSVYDSDGRISPVSIPITISYPDLDGNIQNLTANSDRGVVQITDLA